LFEPNHSAMHLRQGRSPAYPRIPLGEALARAQAQYQLEGCLPIPLASAFKAWGHFPKSSAGRLVRASLRYFGLIVVEGYGEASQVTLTEDALRLVSDEPDAPNHGPIIRRLALNPSAHRKLWAKFPEGIDSDATAARYLEREDMFSQRAAAALVAEFRTTAAFACLYEAKPPLVDAVRGEPADRRSLSAAKLMPLLGRH